MESDASREDRIAGKLIELRSSEKYADHSDRLDDFVMGEYVQAWEQMRHHEDSRLKVFALIFTISLAAIGLIGALITKADSSPDTIRFLCFAICVIVAIACNLVGSMARSIRDFSRFHEGVINGIRKSVLGPDVLDEMDGRAVVYKRNVSRRGLGSTVTLLSNIITGTFAVLAIVFFAQLLS